jgi:hypothetical protein
MNIRSLISKVFGNQPKRSAQISQRMAEDTDLTPLLSITKSMAKHDYDSDVERAKTERSLRQMTELLFTSPIPHGILADRFINGDIAGTLTWLAIGAILDQEPDSLCSALSKHEALFKAELKLRKNPYKALNFKKSAREVVDHETLHATCAVFAKSMFSGSPSEIADQPGQLAVIANKVLTLTCMRLLYECNLLTVFMDNTMSMAVNMLGVDPLRLGKLPEKLEQQAIGWTTDMREGGLGDLQAKAIKMMDISKEALPPNAFAMQCFGLVLTELNCNPTDGESLLELIDEVDVTVADILDELKGE